MYSKKPYEDLTLADFESLGFERIQLLCVVNKASLNKCWEDSLTEIIALRDNYLGIKEQREIKKKALKGKKKYVYEKRKDLLSHWICRVAFCRTAEHRKWFLNQEVKLFRAKMKTVSVDYMSYLEKFYVSCKKATLKKLARNNQEISDALESQISVKNLMELNSSNGFTNLFEVPFESVPDLIIDRKVFLENGIALVPYDSLISLMIAKFRHSLSIALEDMSRSWSQYYEKSDRFVPLNELINVQKSQKEDMVFDDGIIMKTLYKVEFLLEFSPLCMQHIYRTLKAERHLKNKGRLQFGLFLKGIGLSMQEALLFWKNMFAPKISEHGFQKEYSYAIRHQYGREGGNKHYQPYNCKKIIMEQSGPQECHGCPFRTLNEENLSEQLSSMNITGETLEKIINKTKSREYQHACGHVFDAIYGTRTEEGPIHHPNTYFLEARKAL